jgi:hypothetical protein
VCSYAFNYVNNVLYYVRPDGFLDLSQPRCRAIVNRAQCPGILEQRFSDGFVKFVCPSCRSVASRKFRVKFPYKTVSFRWGMGPLVYGPTPHNVSTAYNYRLNKARENNLASHIELTANQERAVRSVEFLRVCDKLATDLATSLYFHDATQDRRAAYSTFEHVKRLLRMNAMLDILTGLKKRIGDVCTGLKHTFVSFATAKFKWEWAKARKAPRQVIDLTTPGSLWGADFMACFKKVLGRYDPLSYWCFAGVPSRDALKEIFRRMRDCQNFFFAFFSDDGIFSIKTSDGPLETNRVVWYNSDIKNCDQSIKDPLFRAFVSLFRKVPNDHIASGLYDQCRLPIKITNPFFNWTQTLRSDEACMYSGSSITTSGNCLGNLLIAASIKGWLDGLGRLPTVIEVEREVPRIARSCGFLLTLERCYHFEDIQFLKLSPDSNCEPFLNLGVMLRALGSCDGDFPGVGTVESRAQARMCDIVRGMQHAGDTHFLRVLQRIFPNGESMFVKYVLSFFLSGAVIDETSILRRYSITRSDYDYMLDLMSTYTHGYYLNCRAMRAIMSKDYGYNGSYDGDFLPGQVLTVSGLSDRRC